MFNDLGNVLLAMCVVIVVGCSVWGAVARLVGRRRARIVHREFQLPTDVDLITGMQALARDIAPARDITRDVHVRYWR